MEPEPRAKKITGWRGAAACVLTVACFCILPCASAQSNAADTVSPAKKTGGKKTSNPKKHAKAESETSRVNTTPAAKAHPASHPPADKHPQSNSSLAAHNNKSKHGTSHKSSKKKTTARGQQKIEPERAQAIQEALIREHYMTGEAAGTWNQASEDAMRRYQADHGWQSKTVPDSRALISLGLGPSHDHLLNPESAMTTGPDVSHAASVGSAPQMPVSHSAEPGARMSSSPTTPIDTAPAPSTSQDSSGPQ